MQSRMYLMILLGGASTLISMQYGCGAKCGPGFYEQNGACFKTDLDGGTDAAGQGPAGDHSGDEEEVGCADEATCAEYAREVAERIDGFRVELGGCEPGSLSWHEGLAGAALDCSDQMRDAQKEGVCNDTLGERMGAHSASHLEPYVENYAKTIQLDVAIEFLDRNPMANVNMRNCNFSMIGIGLTPDANGTVWICITYGTAT